MLQQEGSDTMLELKIVNTEDARITCMQEPVKGKPKGGEQGAWDKSLNGHEDHKYANTKRLYIYNMQ